MILTELWQKQLQDEIEKRDVTIKEYQQKLEDVEASLNRIKVSSGMKDLPENEQIEEYQEQFQGNFQIVIWAWSH